MFLLIDSVASILISEIWLILYHDFIENSSCRLIFLLFVLQLNLKGVNLHDVKAAIKIYYGCTLDISDGLLFLL